MNSVMRSTVYRALFTFVTRAIVMGALVLTLSHAVRPGHAQRAPARPQVRLDLDPSWTERVDRMLDRGDDEGLRRDDARAVPVLVDRLLHEARGGAAARVLERILESRGITDEEGGSIRVRARCASQRDLLAAWYLENRKAMEERW
jgi:hypothetical protein